MSVAAPRIVQSSSLSEAWGRIFLDALRQPSNAHSPVVLTLAGFSGELPDEDPEIRQAVDDALALCQKSAITVSAMTIFPFDLWCRRGRQAWEEFHPLCVNRLFPRLKARDQRNRLGTYFQRMMSYTGIRGSEPKVVDQLGFVIELLRMSNRWPRESALQLSCMDPAKDHTGQPVRGFPCLQQVGISHDASDQIALHAFYPTQYVFDRAYGNYLGLAQLGAYIAHQTGLRFARITCYIGAPQLGDVTKRRVAGLANLIAERLDSVRGAQ